LSLHWDLTRLDRPNGTSTLLSYENLQDTKSLHRLTGVQDVNTNSGANIAGFGYGYDGASVQNGFRDNRTSQTRAYGTEAAQTVSYGYNPTSMLQGEGASQGGTSTPALSKSYAFDAMGNRTAFSDAVAKTQVTSSYNNLNQLVSTNSYDTSSGQAVATGSSALGYDGDGNMALVTAKNAAGTVTGQTSYSYDDASRLIGITAPDGSKWQFVYDGASRLRISRQLDKTGALVPGSEKRRVYLGMDVVQERDAGNNVTASYSGGLSARSTASGTVFYGFDGSGNVTSLTDATGAVVGSYSYDAWGNVVNSSGPKAQENPYRFDGGEQLAGCISFGFRFYNSGLGRWINRDPIAENGGINLYSYVQGNPVNFDDVSGLVPQGHHVVPRAIWGNAPQAVKDVFDSARFRINDRFYTLHNAKRYGGFAEPQYRAAVNDELNTYLTRLGKTKAQLTVGEAEEFAWKMLSKGDGVIGTYNCAVRREMQYQLMKVAMTSGRRGAFIAGDAIAGTLGRGAGTVFKGGLKIASGPFGWMLEFLNSTAKPAY